MLSIFKSKTILLQTYYDFFSYKFLDGEAMFNNGKAIYDEREAMSQPQSG